MRPTLACSFLGAIALGASVNGAHAQSSTTATFEDWVARCNMVRPAGAPQDSAPVKACEMASTIRVQIPESKNAAGQTVPARTGVLAQIVAGRPVPPAGQEGDGKIRFVFQLPLTAFLREPVKMTFASTKEGLDGAQDAMTITATYFSCNARFCLADALLEPKTVETFLTAQVAQLTFTTNAGGERQIKAAVSMRGFSAAYVDITK
ncbi:MAG: invasion associated locus B family protein [Pseudomonadota bacterium]